MRQPPENQPDNGWLREVRVTFDRDELEGFFDGFSPMESPSELLDSLFESDTGDSVPCAA